MTDIIKLAREAAKGRLANTEIESKSLVGIDEIRRFAELVTAPLKAENEALRADAERLYWLQSKLFMKRWNGVVGAGCLTQWSIAPDYRHSLTTMQTSDIEIDFRGAIDAARAKEQTP